MRKFLYYFLPLLLCFLFFWSLSQHPTDKSLVDVANATFRSAVVGGGAVAPAGCTEIWAEDFEGAGYENGACGAAPCWTEVIGTGSTIDEDDTDWSPSGSQSLEMTTDSGTADWSYTRFDDDAESPIVYFVGEFIIDSEDLGQSQYTNILEFLDTENNVAVRIHAYYDSGILYLLPYIYHTSALQEETNKAINVSTSYTIQIKYDATNGAFDLSLDGVSWDSGTGLSNMRDGIEHYRFSVAGFDNFNIDWNWDNMVVCSDGYAYD